MDWNQAIDRQRNALTGIVAALFAMIGLVEGGSVSRLPLPLYRAVLRILYPAESAVRRLIVVMARALTARVTARRPVPAGLKALPRKASGRATFQLCDPRHSFNSKPRRIGRRFEPRLHAFVDGQLVTVIGRSPFDPSPPKRSTIEATRLCRRLFAIRSALDNLPREARRLARWRARQTSLPPEKFKKPIRPGRPPGHRKVSVEDVDEVLKDCHWLAWEAAKLDTS